jgi:hypothetical protein
MEAKPPQAAQRKQTCYMPFARTQYLFFIFY